MPAGSEPDRRYRDRSTASSSLLNPSMRPASSILDSITATLTILLSNITASLLPILASVKRPKRLPPSGDRVKLVSHLRMSPWLGGARLGLGKLGIERQHAALLGEGRFAAGERSILDFGDFQDGRRADQLLDPRRIVHARQLHQYLVLIARPPVLLHRRLDRKSEEHTSEL